MQVKVKVQVNVKVQVKVKVKFQVKISVRIMATYLSCASVKESKMYAFKRYRLRLRAPVPGPEICWDRDHGTKDRDRVWEQDRDAD